MRGVPAAFVESWREPRKPGPGLALYRLTQDEDIVHIEDVAADGIYRAGDPVRRALVELGGARTSLHVALRKDGLLLGAFVVYRQEVRLFADKQIALLQNFAAQAVIAIENTRLITETQEALQQQTATAEVLGVINSSPGEITPVFDAMLEKAVRLCEAHHGVMYTQDGDQFRVVALSDEVPKKFAEFLRGVSLPLGPDTFVGRVMRDRSPLHIADITTEEPYLRRLPIAVASVEFGVRTLLSVPLMKDASPVGIFSLARQEVRPFTDRQIALVWTILPPRR